MVDTRYSKSATKNSVQSQAWARPAPCVRLWGWLTGFKLRGYAWKPQDTAEHRRTPQDALATTARHPNYTQMTNMNVSKKFCRSVLMF